MGVGYLDLMSAVVKHLAVRPTARPIGGLRRIGPRRASGMGDSWEWMSIKQRFQLRLRMGGAARRCAISAIF
jgi:hypothetical protein